MKQTKTPDGNASKSPAIRRFFSEGESNDKRQQKLKASQHRVPILIGRTRAKYFGKRHISVPIFNSQPASSNVNKAFEQYTESSILQDPFWLQQFALKKAQRDHIQASYNLIDAENLKTTCFPGWGAAEPVAAMNKRADRHQVFSVMVNGQRLYPVEQFNPKADSPKLSSAFAAMVKACTDNGGISQEEMLFWIASEQPLPESSTSVVNQAIEAEDLAQGWETLRDAGASEALAVRPLDCLLQGEEDLALQLFRQWTDVEQDEPEQSRDELIAAVKALITAQCISIDELK